MPTRMLILLAAAGLSFAGAAGAAFAQAQPGYSDGYGYDVDHVYDDGYGYTGNDQTAGDGSTDGFTCSDAYGSCGWYDGLFYPGFGAFVFDRHHNRHRMTSLQRDHFNRQAQGFDGRRRFGFGSGGGLRRSMPQSQGMSSNGGIGARSTFGFGGGMVGARRP